MSEAATWARAAANLLPRLGYVDLNISYGVRGFGGTAGVMKQATGSLRSGWHLYCGAGLSSPGPSIALTVSPNSVSPGWNAAASHSDGTTMYQVGADLAGSPFTEIGLGGPRGTALIAYRAWRLGTV